MPVRTTEQERRARAAALLEEPKLDVLLVSNLHNVRYLTGFTGSNAMALLYRTGDCILYTDPRYTVQSHAQVSCRIRIAKGPLIKQAAHQIARGRFRHAGFELNNLTVAQFEVLKQELPPRTHPEPSDGLIEKLRMVKDAAEIERVRASVLSNSQAYEAAMKRFRIGMKEADLAAEIDYQNRRLGAEAPSFDTIVAAGERAALPHASPGAAKIGPGMLLVDMGAFRNGYASDMTRMAHAGPAAPKYKHAYRAVLEAQLAAIDTVKPGIKAGFIDRTSREVLKKHGFEREFVHSTGHGLGLEIHEPPRLGRKEKTKLAAGMTITIEPGVYVEGWGGIRIEDTVLVTAKGCEVLTPTSKELREI